MTTRLFLFRRAQVTLSALLLLLILPARAATERFQLQWQEPDAAHPWLGEVSVAVFSGKATVTTQPLPAAGGDYGRGLAIALDAAGDAGEPVELQVRLAGGYGFVVSAAMLRDEPYIWVKDLGLYLSREGWAATAPARAETARQVEASRAKPFVSAAEQYHNWTGFTNHLADDIHSLTWQFLDAKERWPAEARAVERIASQAEADVAYFTQRIPDYDFSKMFLGWPDHNDQFTLWSHGRVTVSSQSVGGDPKVKVARWHPRAGAYSFQFAVSASPLPRYREYGDPNVHQRLTDGYNLVTTTSWEDDGFRIEHTCFAAPQDFAPIRTGIEQLLLWSRLEVTNTAAEARDAWLGLQFNDEDFVTFHEASPLPGTGEIAWRDGGFYAGDLLVAAADPALVFERLPAHGPVSRFRAKVPLAAGAKRSFGMVNFYRPAAGGGRPAADLAAFDTARTRMVAFWDGIAAAGASITVPDPWLNNLYRTFLPRLLNNSHLDPDGHPVMVTGPIQYARVWHHITALGLAGDLARRGQFEQARRHYETFFRWQGIPAPDSPSITDWEGFFGAPPEQCPKVWLSYQGMVLWSIARYCRLSGDRAWVEERMPAIIKALEWVQRNRRTTMRLEADGSMPFNYGWLPPGRVGDAGKGDNNGIYSDASTWMGMQEMAAVLRQIGHPRAAEFQAEADDYRRCIQDGERRSAATRPLVRLNDHTWLPYLPALLQSAGRERDKQAKYTGVIDSAWAWGILDTGVFGRGSPEAGWIVNLWEDSYAMMIPGLCDEPFCSGPMAEYLATDRVENYLYNFYSQSTNTLDRETLTTIEHYSWGMKRAFELTGWSAGYWTTNFTNMLCRTVGDELWLLQATPRRWLEDGKEISVQKLQTEFGPVSVVVRSRLGSGMIEAAVQPPGREPPSRLRLRLRVPEGHTLRSVTVNGRAWTDFDAAGGWINLPANQAARVSARY